MRYRRSLTLLVVALVSLLLPAQTASAARLVAIGSSAPNPVMVGATVPASIDISNFSTPPNQTETFTVSNITFVPSCSIQAAPCPPGSRESGVFLPSGAVGQAGTACAGITFAITESSPGLFEFNPSGPVVLSPPGNPTSVCTINFTMQVLRVPTVDTDPSPGVQTVQTTAATAQSSAGPVLNLSGTDQLTVTRDQPQLATTASPGGPVGTSVSDTAMLSDGTNPTGTITFILFGPDDATCARPPVFTSTVPVTGNGNYTSDSFNTTQPGTYQWTASYSGDANNNPIVTACGDPGETVVISGAAGAPSIRVFKDAAPLTRPEPGGTFTFTVRIQNTGPGPVTITAITDNIHGNLATRPGSTCDGLIGTVLASGATSAPCTFTDSFTGNAGATQTDIVTATAVDQQGTTATDNDDATVGITDVAPTVNVRKTANPTSRPAPGGDFTYTIVTTNTSSVEPETITSITDDVYGNLSTRGTCTTAVGTTLAPNGGTYTCSFTAPFTGAAGATLTDVATVVVVDDEGNTVADSDDATVTIGAATVQLVVNKAATPASRPEPGGDFTFPISVTNAGSANVTITSITDDIYGDLSTRQGSTCNTAIGAVVPPGGAYTCQFTAPFTGPGGASQTDVVTVTAVDASGQSGSDTDDATVTITNVQPTIRVTKTANPTSRPTPGGDFTYTIDIVNNSGSSDPVTITTITDNVYGNLATRPSSTCGTRIGTVLSAGASTSCQFTAPFTGNPGDSLTDIATVTASDDEGTVATASDDATVTITAGPLLSLMKTCSPTNPGIGNGTLIPGQTASCTLSVSNPGGAPTNDVVVTDNLGAGTTATQILSTSGTGFTCVIQNNGAQVRCTDPSIGPGQTDTVTYKIRADSTLGPDVPLTNSATATASNAPSVTRTVTLRTPACTHSGSGTITGTPNNDVLCGSAGFDSLSGLGGNDVLFGFGGNDSLSGGSGNDHLFGGDGYDSLGGGSGNDSMWGGTGNDTLNGGSDLDFADGGPGTETCVAESTQNC